MDDYIRKKMEKKRNGRKCASSDFILIFLLALVKKMGIFMTYFLT